LAYARPIIEEFGNPAVARMKVWCDGVQLAEGRGMAVVANYRQYALRVDPCPDAQWHDGQLDVVFIPVETAIDTLTALARLRLRWPSPEIAYGRGSTVRMELTGDARLQMDGEAETCLNGFATQTIVYATRTGVMPVLDAR
jgi:diacylglycerol kinase family enzyme